MAITQLFIKKGNFIQDIEIDAVISESATATARLTKNPVEYGADSSDHIIIEPQTYTLNGVVSNASSNLVDAAKNLLGNQTKAQQIWEDLLELLTNKKPFTLVQGLKSYDNVVLTNLTESQDKDTSKGLFFTAQLSQLILVGTGGSPTTTFKDQDTSDKATPKTNGGLKSIA